MVDYFNNMNYIIIIFLILFIFCVYYFCVKLDKSVKSQDRAVKPMSQNLLDGDKITDNKHTLNTQTNDIYSTDDCLKYIDYVCKNLNNHRTKDNSKFLNDLYRKYDNLNNSTLIDHMMEMLINPTKYENLLYDYLSNEKIFYIKQCPCLGYILDCYIPQYNINIEVDCEFHKEQKEKDWKRSQDIFKAFKIKTYRISNKQMQYGYYKQILKDLIDKYETV